MAARQGPPLSHIAPTAELQVAAGQGPPYLTLPPLLHFRWQQGKDLWVEVGTLEAFDREVLAADRLVVVDWWG